MKIELEHFSKVLSLIPEIISTVKESLEIELTKIPHDLTRLKNERILIKDIAIILQGKWTIDIIYYLRIVGESHYNTLKELLNGISSRVLTDRLRFFEKKGIIERKIHDASPVRISYKLTEYGESIFHLLVPVFLYSISKEKENQT